MIFKTDENIKNGKFEINVEKTYDDLLQENIKNKERENSNWNIKMKN